MRGAGRLYLVHVAVATLGVALLAGSTGLLLADQSFAVPSSQAISEACDNWISAGGPAALLGLAIAALAVTSILLGIRSVHRQVKASRRYLAKLPIGSESVEIDGTQFHLIECDRPQAFCAGYLRPRIYLSRGVRRQLDADELSAVVAHEAHHATRCDPLRLLAARALADSLFFVPILRRISERYRALGELAADEAAVSMVRDRGPLASALLKFSEPGVQPAPVVSIAPERVDNLLGDPEAARWKLPASQLGRSALVLAALAATVLLVWHGIVNPNLQIPLLLAAACMGLMVGGPVILGIGALLLSRRVLSPRRT
jgi:beta-lactamase regulating signal transducer with metallopeptidase domain